MMVKLSSAFCMTGLGEQTAEFSAVDVAACLMRHISVEGGWSWPTKNVFFTFCALQSVHGAGVLSCCSQVHG